ncbi:hypothetical protein [Effusibacillus dendaii]|uniref:Uncharacterized protein n=1 Tax=Effusibacillus dendaii TaxID=2743772 RepID=A0A7I8DG23_9BACL|nr:hypothetical protein [Effusibacillus dendaii]BCJ86831.1 hypothetical protein skT53_18160 [Effusibacillus dendaii]
MLRTIVAYSLFFEGVFGLATIFWWWKRCDKLEKTIVVFHMVGAAAFGYTMLL